MCIDEIEDKINHIQAQLNLNEDNEPVSYLLIIIMFSYCFIMIVNLFKVL